MIRRERINSNSTLAVEPKRNSMKAHGLTDNLLNGLRVIKFNGLRAHISGLTGCHCQLTILLPKGVRLNSASLRC
jgi:hypothetical protein